MPLTRKQKEAQVDLIQTKITNSNFIVVWDFLGLTSNEFSELRLKIKKENGKNIIYKNRVAKVAFEKENKKEIIEHLKGPSSFLFIEEENDNALKELYKEVKKNKKISFKAGYINGEFYGTKEMLEFASLPSRNELLSMLLSALQGPIRKLACDLSEISKLENTKD